MNHNYTKGARFEREIIRRFMRQGAVLAVRAAGSKCYAKNPKLKVDVVVFKPPYVYLVQAKRQEKARSKQLKEFGKSVEELRLCYGGEFLKGIFVENIGELDGE